MSLRAVCNREQFKVCEIVKLPKFHLKIAVSKMTIFIGTLINIQTLQSY